MRKSGKGNKGKSFEVEIQTPRGVARGVIHGAENARGAALMVGGAGGGIHGPANIYEKLAARLQMKGITSLRLDYRHPNHLAECVYDAHAGVEALGKGGVERAVLIGWSFGGAVVISAGARNERVVGVATIATQTYGADEVGELSPKSLLLLHGTADGTLPPRCSRDLYERAGDPKKLVLYENDNHGITVHAREMLDELNKWASDLLLRDHHQA